MTARKTGMAAAARRTVKAMRAGGKVEPVDELVVATVLYTSGELDNLPPDTPATPKASLVRAHVAAVKLLRDRDEGGMDEGTAALIAALSTPPAYPTEAELRGDWSR